MKQLFLILCISIIFNSFLIGQEKLAENIPKDILDCLTEMGKDTVSTLNVCESKCLNFYFQKNKGMFDFCKKRVAFFKGSSGTVKSTKKEYFDQIKRSINNSRFLLGPSNQLIIFNKDEVKQTGYDAVIISLSKKYTTSKEAVKMLKKQK